MNYELINNYARVFLATLDSDLILDNINYLVEKLQQIKSLSSMSGIKQLLDKEQYLANNLLFLLKSNGRMELLPEILQTMLYLYQERFVHDVKVYLAPGSEDNLYHIQLKAKEIISHHLHLNDSNKIKLEFIQDSSLIWGFKIQIQDVVLDYSLSGMIKRCLK